MYRSDSMVCYSTVNGKKNALKPLFNRPLLQNFKGCKAKKIFICIQKKKKSVHCLEESQDIYKMYFWQEIKQK